MIEKNYIDLIGGEEGFDKVFGEGLEEARKQDQEFKKSVKDGDKVVTLTRAQYQTLVARGRANHGNVELLRVLTHGAHELNKQRIEQLEGRIAALEKQMSTAKMKRVTEGLRDAFANKLAFKGLVEPQLEDIRADIGKLQKLLKEATLNSSQFAVLPMKINEIEIRLGELRGLEYCGVFVDGTTYKRNSVVTHSGSMWVALERTTEVPNKSMAWQLAVKRGRDGKDAR